MKKWIEIALILILSVVTLASMSILILLHQRRNRRGKGGQVDPGATTKSTDAQRTTPLKQLFHKKDFEEKDEARVQAEETERLVFPQIATLNFISLTSEERYFHEFKDAKFDSDKPVMFSLEDMYEATKDFDDARKIGEGRYGSVYFGILGDQEVAIKKMKSSRLKEFFAEIKVLCKIHHINVLLGYSSSDNHLYLVYEYVPRGSLNDHIHDPLLKGHQPLSWTARANIALDAAKGIEYIHDHTKVRYVHCDIKTSNILLNQGLRAKVMGDWFKQTLLTDVADFGLARLVEQSNEQEVFATRVVGTPGYIPPEFVRELRMTSKGDVYAFGVVLAEIVTGQRALARDDGAK